MDPRLLAQFQRNIYTTPNQNLNTNPNDFPMQELLARLNLQMPQQPTYGIPENVFGRQGTQLLPQPSQPVQPTYGIPENAPKRGVQLIPQKQYGIPETSKVGTPLLSQKQYQAQPVADKNRFQALKKMMEK